MSKQDDGRPAFPLSAEAEARIGEGYGFANQGMTLRDYFAGQALVGATSDNDAVWTLEGMAKWAYTVADAMILARNEGGDDGE